MREIDLTIIGSGPAGISTALHLIQQDPGWTRRMILLEKASHPRHKLCGGGLTRLGIKTLHHLGFQLPLPIPQEWVEDVRFVYQGRTIHVRGDPQLIIFNRAELDAFLAEQARLRGLTIQQNEAVKQIRIDEQGVVVKTERECYYTRIVVGADGAKGVSRKFLAGQGEKSRAARLLEVVNPAPRTALEFLEGYAIFEFSPTRSNLQGYFWDFPTLVGGLPHYNRGIYDARLATSRKRASLPSLFAKGLMTCGQDPQLANVEGHPIHRFSPHNRFAMPRLLLVGDASGVDPLFGEGIAPALAYGEVAAASIRDAFAREDFSFRDYRRRVLLSPLGQYLMVRWAIAWVSYHLSGNPAFMHMLWTLGAIANQIFAQPEPLADRLASGERARPDIRANKG